MRSLALTRQKRMLVEKKARGLVWRKKQEQRTVMRTTRARANKVLQKDIFDEIYSNLNAEPCHHYSF